MEPRHTYDQYREFCELARQKKVIFYYVGYFSQSIVTAMAEAVRLRLEQSGTAGPTRRRLFSSFVEMAQNIIHYSADTLTPPEQNQNELRHGSVCIGIDEEGRYFLLCANPISLDLADALRERLETLRTMTLEEILTNRNRLSDDILRDVEKAAGGYGVAIARADVKDLVFP
ncbi:MAG: SiaB family protein kinase, partial [Burkholderiaceae bacterium]|nr:SiaB family protein kinase [Burkholderiaceae bacterium]